MFGGDYYWYKFKIKFCNTGTFIGRFVKINGVVQCIALIYGNLELYGFILSSNGLVL